jgi:hypothetical protein
VTLSNRDLTLAPSKAMAVTIMAAIPAAITAYSIAVAPL